MTANKIIPKRVGVRPARKTRAENESLIESDRSKFKGFEKALDAAEYFGFVPIKTPEIKKEDLARAKDLKICCDPFFSASADSECFSVSPEERLALLRNYIEDGIISWSQPAMLFYRRPTLKKSVREINLDILGSPRSILEALIIKTAITILEDGGFGNLSVEINSIGDKESFSRFERQLVNFFKKNSETLVPQCRQAYKKDPLSAPLCEHEKCNALKADSPKPISFLSDQSREHFKEILEHLEVSGIQYRINNGLVGNKNYCYQTVFKITGSHESERESEPQTLAIGMRYNGLAKKTGLKKDVQGAGVSINLAGKKTEEKVSIKTKKPDFYLIQLGFEAKLKSLEVIDELRKARIPIYHSLVKDKLAAQLSIAENLDVDHVIIIGQKEALENSVVVRNVNTRSQETVSLCRLADYVNRLKCR